MFHMNKPLIARPYNPMSVAAPHASWVAAEFTKKNHTCHALDHVERPPTLVSKRTHLFFLLTAPLTIEIATPYNSAEAREYFNPHALETSILGENPIDLGYFASQGGQLPGIYNVDIYLNDSHLSKRVINFVSIGGKLHPELTSSQLQEMGVKLEAFPALQQLPSSSVISLLSDYIPHASSRFDFNLQRLDISIPQAALTSKAQGSIDPELWDQGLPAAFLNYSVSGSNTHNDNLFSAPDNYYNLRSGLNLGEWRLRNYSTYDSRNGKKTWANLDTFIQRDIQALKGQFIAGDSSTPSDVFNSVLFSGVQLSSDDNMHPDSLKGFAPVVRGIAQSNARVTVRQNGYLIYQTYVPAGAFTITDLYPTSSSGDLEITITENTGTEHRSVQSFAAVPVMLREGRLKYSVTAGHYRSNASTGNKPLFMQGTMIYGLPYDATLYGGLLASEKYTATSIGIGHTLYDWGAVSMDVTQAQTEISDSSSHRGQSYRFLYSKNIKATDTTFTLAGFRYSTGGYYDFQEANDIDPDNFNNWRETNKRSKAQVNINQSFGDKGNFYINGYQQNFWRQNRYERSLTAGYNFNYRGISYGLAYTMNQALANAGRNDKDQQLAFKVQIPLGKTLTNSWASYNLNASKQGNTSHDIGLSGTTLADNNLSYSLQQRHTHQRVGGSGNASLNYKGTYGEVRAGYNYDNNAQQINYNFQGGVVAHPYGVTFSQQQGETMALVRAPGAAGVNVKNNVGVGTDWRGYAIVPYLSTYRKNRIALDTETLAEDVDIEINTRTIVPTKGALVLADFQTRVGRRVLINLSHEGKPVPFGATATLLENSTHSKISGVVGFDGEVYLSGVPQAGEIHVKWGSESAQQCKAHFTLPDRLEDKNVIPAILTLSTMCKQVTKQ